RLGRRTQAMGVISVGRTFLSARPARMPAPHWRSEACTNPFFLEVSMSWLANFSLVIRSSITGLCERFENPERMLNQLVIDMEEELERVRGNVAGVIADEIQLGRQVDKARAEVSQWHQRAATALQRHDEASAKAAIEQKALGQQRAGGLAKEQAKPKDETSRLHRA